MRRALTVGTSDSSGLGGVQADAHTFSSLRVHGTCVVTAVAARNTRALAAVAEVPEEVVISQIDTVLEDIGADAVKIGELWSRAISENVADRLEAWGNDRIVVAPGLALLIEAGRLTPDYLTSVRSDLLPHAFLLALDEQELSLLIEAPIDSTGAVIDAARLLQQEGKCAVLLMASASDMSHDLLIDGDAVMQVPRSARANVDVATAAALLTGAITGFLAHELDLESAVREAGRVRDNALTQARSRGEGVEVPRQPEFEHGQSD